MSNLTSIFKSVPTSDWIATFIALILILILLFIFEIASKKYGLKKSHSRKAVHFIVGILICIASYLLISNVPILILALTFLFFDWWAIKTHHFTSIHQQAQSLGTVFYPLAVFLLALLLWYNHKPIFIIAILIMVIPDSLAALVGEKYPERQVVLLKEKKSVQGAVTMFISTQVLVFIALYVFRENALSDSVIISIMIALLATASELLSIKGSDNLSVPVLSALFLYAYLDNTLKEQLTLGIILSTITGYLSYKLKFLTIDGALMAFILGSILFGFGGIPFAVPILVFFLFSSLLSFVGKKKKKPLESLYAKTGKRDLYQVNANGGIAAIVVLVGYLFSMNTIYPVYLVAIAAATADTLATELGVFSKKKPRLITNLRQVRPGTSGAISFLGSFAALLGSTIIAMIGYLINPEKIGIDTEPQVVLGIVIIAGFISSFIDSILGATVQGQYNCTVCNNLTERTSHCGCDTQLVKGYRFITNDFVNIFSILTVTFLTFMYYIYCI